MRKAIHNHSWFVSRMPRLCHRVQTGLSRLKKPLLRGVAGRCVMTPHLIHDGQMTEASDNVFFLSVCLNTVKQLLHCVERIDVLPVKGVHHLFVRSNEDFIGFYALDVSKIAHRIIYLPPAHYPTVAHLIVLVFGRSWKPPAVAGVLPGGQHIPDTRSNRSYIPLPKPSFRSAHAFSS